MTVLTKVGQITAKTSTGNQSYTGVGFQPKGIIFYGTLQTASGFSGGACADSFIGFAGTDLSNGSAGWAADDAVSSSNVSGVSGQLRCIDMLRSGTPTQDGQATIVTMDADGFTLNWATAASNAWLINYFAVGGDSIDRTRTGPFSISTSGTTQSTSNPNFRPSFVMFVNQASPSPCIGIASGPSSSEQVSLFWFEQDATSPTNIKSTWSPGNFVGGYRTVTTPNNIQQDFLGALSGFTTSGFSVTFSDLPANNRAGIYFAIKGGRHKVGLTTVPAATGTQSLTATFPVQGAGFLSDERAADSDDSYFAFGATDGTTSETAAWYSTDNVATTQTDTYNAAHALIAKATLGTPSADSVADFQSFGAQSINLNWAAVSGAQERYAYWLMGPGSEQTGQIIRYR